MKNSHLGSISTGLVTEHRGKYLHLVAALDPGQRNARGARGQVELGSLVVKREGQLCNA